MAEARAERAELRDGFETRLQACGLGDAEAPRQALVAPWGEVNSARGTFVVDAAAGAAVIAAFGAHGTDLPIDYEHQSLGGEFASPDGLAPAAGWIRALHLVSPGEESAERGSAGLWAEVEWTPSARERLAAREYRYLSPVVLVRRSDRRVVALHSAALTNKPAIAGMRAIVNSDAAREASPHAIAIESPAESDGWSRLRAALGLNEGDAETVLLAASTRLAAMSAQSAEHEAAQRVTQASARGKLPASLREWALRLALKDPGCFDEWVSAAPVLVATGRTAPPARGGGSYGREAIAASARAAFRADPELGLITSEEAWVAQALREADLKPRINADERR